MVILSGEPIFIDTEGMIILIGLAFLILILAPYMLDWMIDDKDTL
jgi:hypothetical protein